MLVPFGSQTQPLSPDQIKRCADDFKFKYQTTLCMIRADALNPDSIVPFNDMYTNLLLKEKYREHKRPLEYRDLFDLKVNGEFPKRIMIQGEAGAGKTTFCSKIAWDWINDSPVLPKFVWVLVVPLCEAKQYTIGEIAKSYLSKDNPATACQITEYIRSNAKDVFIAFDGLDEFDGKVVQQRKVGSKSECLQPKSTDQTKARGSSSERGDIALIDILRSDELDACPVLVTSRPRKVTEFTWDKSLRKLYTFLYVEGFSKENVEVYIHKYFEDDVAKAEQLIQLTKESDIISEYMEYFAGVHLASLYELDRYEFNRLIEQVVLPRKEAFRYLLYFTVSRDKTIANHIMKCMVQGNTTNQEEMDFLVDVSFESQDLDTVALLRGRVSPLKIDFRTAHIIAAYVFTGLYVDVVLTLWFMDVILSSASVFHAKPD
eukprot:XP_011660706.1 PREDICTED: NACHT, LRR and PYD domains-containing protein 3-like [Strongylocentrotus purpuratus]